MKVNEVTGNVSLDAKFFTNDDVVEPAQGWVGEDGLVEIERTDEDEVGIHFRHVMDEQATITGYLTCSEALAMAHALTVAALAHWPSASGRERAAAAQNREPEGGAE